MEKLAVFTIGHSTHPIEEFIDILKAHGVQRLVDIRTVPKSRRNPQFHTDALADSLSKAGIHYTHMPGLGGLRKPLKDSPNGAWRNDSFRGYADYMQTAAFQTALGQLIELAEGEQVAIMCAEAVPWRCHRSLVGDALLARGIVVEDIMSKTSRKPHSLTSFAVLNGENVTYPAEPATKQQTLPI